MRAGRVPAARRPPRAPDPRRSARRDRLRGLHQPGLGSGARAFGMGGAFLARADDATAASWNPAGLSYLRRPEFSIVGARNSFERGDFGGHAPTDTLRRLHARLRWRSPTRCSRARRGAAQLPARLLVPRHARDRARRTHVHARKARAASTCWPSGAAGASDARCAWAAPSTAGSTATARGGCASARPHPATTEQDIDYDLNSGINFNLGVIWTPIENLNLGVVAKTPFTAILDLRRFRRDTGLPDDHRRRHREPRRALGRAARPARRRRRRGCPGGRPARSPSPPTTRARSGRRAASATSSCCRRRRSTALRRRRSTSASCPIPRWTTRTRRTPSRSAWALEVVAIVGRVRVPLRGGLFWDRQYFRAESPTGPPPRFEGFTVGTGISVGPMLLDIAYLSERGRFLTADEADPRQHPLLARLRVDHLPARPVARPSSGSAGPGSVGTSCLKRLDSRAKKPCVWKDSRIRHLAKSR